MLRTLASASLLATAGAMQLTTNKGPCANLNGQWQNKEGVVMTVKQKNCDVDVTGIWDKAQGYSTKTGIVGGNSLHVKGFDTVGFIKDGKVTFKDGAFWQQMAPMMKNGMFNGRTREMADRLTDHKKEYRAKLAEEEKAEADVQDKAEILVEKTGEAKESKAVVESDAKVAEMIKTCNWDCYLQRYPGLKSKTWEAEHPKKGLEYAKTHYIKYGHAAGRNCQCDADMLAVKMVQHSEDAAEVQAQLAEQTDVLAEAAAEADLIKDCDWGCYLDRYPKLRNEKWEQERGNHDYARKHYLQFGRSNGKNCKCGDGPKNLFTGASLLATASKVHKAQGDIQGCTDLSGHWKNQHGNIVTVKQEHCDVEISVVFDAAVGEVTKKGLVGGNSLHVKDFATVGTFKDNKVTFNDGGHWEYIEDNTSNYDMAHMFASDAKAQKFVQTIAADEVAESKFASEAETSVAEMVKSCNWDCYLKRYPGLKSKTWEAEHPKKGLEYAKLHYIKYGRTAGRNCQCDADMLAQKLVEQPWDAARLQGQLAEQTEVLAEASAEVELIKGCDWNCYLDRYPKLRNEKWDQEKGNQDYARSHYLRFGREAGKNCKCSGGKYGAMPSADSMP